MKQLGLFVMLVLVWVLLVWPPGVQDIVAGVVVALFVAWLLRDPPLSGHRVWIQPMRYLWFFAYLGVLTYYVIKANFDVAYRVLHPAMPIRPGIVKVKTELKTAPAITALANSITLTPGTLTVNASSDGILYVHWINVTTMDTEEASECIVRRFEWFLKRIFE